MKNDINLTHRILSEIEGKNDLRPALVTFADLDEALVNRHVKRLYDDGMIDGIMQEFISPPGTVILAVDLTTRGHSYLASLEAA